MVAGSYCLISVVLVNAYTGSWTSNLATPNFKPIPNSFEELAASADYKFGAAEKYVLTDTILVTIPPNK